MRIFLKKSNFFKILTKSKKHICYLTHQFKLKKREKRGKFKKRVLKYLYLLILLLFFYYLSNKQKKKENLMIQQINFNKKNIFLYYKITYELGNNNSIFSNIKIKVFCY